MLKNKEEVDMKNTISVRSHISLEKIEDLLYSADRGTDYWNEGHRSLGFERNVKHILANPKDGIKIEDIEGGDGDNPKIHFLSLPKIKKGLTILAKKYPHHLCDILNDETDMITADVLVQCSIFGDIIYS